MDYRRAWHKGGTYFFTVNLADRTQALLTLHIKHLHQVIAQVKRAHPFKIEAIVILPDHLHTIWTLPEGDTDYPKRWALIKAKFSRAIPKAERINPSRIHKRERGIWQRRYWEHQIKNEQDMQAHADYIHYNPVKHGYVKNAADWPYSSIHQYIKAGILPKDWGAHEVAQNQFGEADL